MPLCKEFEEKLIKYIWRTRKIGRKSTIGAPILHQPNPSETGSQANLNEKDDESSKAEAVAARNKKPPSRKWWSWRLQPPVPASPSSDPEKGPRKERKLVLLGPLYAGCGAALAMCM